MILPSHSGDGDNKIRVSKSSVEHTVDRWRNAAHWAIWGVWQRVEQILVAKSVAVTGDDNWCCWWWNKDGHWTRLGIKSGISVTADAVSNRRRLKSWVWESTDKDKDDATRRQVSVAEWLGVREPVYVRNAYERKGERQWERWSRSERICCWCWCSFREVRAAEDRKCSWWRPRCAQDRQFSCADSHRSASSSLLLGRWQKRRKGGKISQGNDARSVSKVSQIGERLVKSGGPQWCCWFCCFDWCAHSPRGRRFISQRKLSQCQSYPFWSTLQAGFLFLLLPAWYKGPRVRPPLCPYTADFQWVLSATLTLYSSHRMTMVRSSSCSLQCKVERWWSLKHPVQYNVSSQVAALFFRTAADERLLTLNYDVRVANGAWSSAIFSRNQSSVSQLAKIIQFGWT